jgi:hypothetical protein
VEGLGGGGGEAEAWGGNMGAGTGLELEEQQGYGGGREEGKSQLEGVLGYFFFSVSGNGSLTYSVSSCR